MPRIRTGETGATDAQASKLTQLLADEMKKEVDLGQPLEQPIIVENKIGRSGSLHVAVIWERWGLVPAGERSRIVFKAYEQVDPDQVDSITIALGATTLEAIDLGLLPYGVEPTIKEGDGVSPQRVDELLQGERAVATPSGLILRFPSRDAAEAARQRLVEKSDERFWALVRYESVQM